MSKLVALGMMIGAGLALRAQPGEGKKITREEFEKRLTYQTGKVELPGGMASPHFSQPLIDPRSPSQGSE